MAKKTDVFYSLLNVTNGNILSACLNGAYGAYNKKEGDVLTRQRNWKISQFNLWGTDVLDYFINSKTINVHSYWHSMGVQEIWCKEDEIDLLYTVLAVSTLQNFCSYDKQKALIGAFLFQKDPNLFLSEDFTSTHASAQSTMKKLKCGKEFLEWLETFNILSFAKSRYNYQKRQHEDEQRFFFSCAELELISKERQYITTKFEMTITK